MVVGDQVGQSKGETVSEVDAESAQVIHIIAGPTGVGKSTAATELARVTGAPIVVADRIQCFTDLATTSARAGDEEAGVQRVRLAERTVADGDFTAADALDSLIGTLRELGERHPLLIVEGGSISLLWDFAELLPELGFRATARLMHIGDRQEYVARLTRRARRMLIPEGSGTSTLEELAIAWKNVDQRPFVASVNGFGAILEWCATHSVAVESLASAALSEEQVDELARLIAIRHAEHGVLQDRIFSMVFDAFEPLTPAA
ncbi:isopentenyl transferase family protein [Streptomyces millisiae]|uniref:Isopentenyl transferase family protein n=1 Tax=Streptomyces millisiae TaxID=3075542 RepID=A0ABU2M158_9ACTN|nr:isopentenyl transferase family protein [Streptomyces sp. DSM 44918]MDT0323589.1 isopentenyl transferase family protein [Streptomyces sp. DSM 44918]